MLFLWMKERLVRVVVVVDIEKAVATKLGSTVVVVESKMQSTQQIHANNRLWSKNECKNRAWFLLMVMVAL